MHLGFSNEPYSPKTQPMPTLSKFVLSGLVLILFSATLTAQAVAPSGPITQITFDKLEYDFGVIEEGTIVSQVFTFTNTGDEPLILSDAKGSCGCTVPEWPHEPIQPGETASLTVEFNSKNKWGKRRQKVTLTANTDPPQSFIYLTGEILRPEGADDHVIIIGDEDEAAPSAKPQPQTPKPSFDCFIVYPNPTAELLKLEVQEADLGQRAVVTIYSQSGQLMARREIAQIEAAIVEFGVGHYPAGQYVAQVQIGERRPESRCFVVTK